jgi:hypothetical protein
VASSDKRVNNEMVRMYKREFLGVQVEVSRGRKTKQLTT